jgi:hypothetical protein
VATQFSGVDAPKVAAKMLEASVNRFLVRAGRGRAKPYEKFHIKFVSSCCLLS